MPTYDEDLPTCDHCGQEFDPEEDEWSQETRDVTIRGVLQAIPSSCGDCMREEMRRYGGRF